MQYADVCNFNWHDIGLVTRLSPPIPSSSLAAANSRTVLHSDTGLSGLSRKQALKAMLLLLLLLYRHEENCLRWSTNEKKNNYLRRISSIFHWPVTMTSAHYNYDNDINQSNDDKRSDNSRYQRNKFQSGWRWCLLSYKQRKRSFSQTCSRLLTNQLWIIKFWRQTTWALLKLLKSIFDLPSNI